MAVTPTSREVHSVHISLNLQTQYHSGTNIHDRSNACLDWAIYHVPGDHKLVQGGYGGAPFHLWRGRAWGMEQNILHYDPADVYFFFQLLSHQLFISVSLHL